MNSLINYTALGMYGKKDFPHCSARFNNVRAPSTFCSNAEVFKDRFFTPINFRSNLTFLMFFPSSSLLTLNPMSILIAFSTKGIICSK